MNRYLGFALALTLCVGTACGKEEGDDGEGDGSSGGAGTNASAGGSGAPSGGSGAPAGGSTSTAAGTSGGGSGSGAGEGGSSSSAGMCVNEGEINYDCPFNLPPIDGSCAPHGTCCRRASNNAKIAALGPDEPAVVEYRLNFVDVINHPKTVGNPVLVSGAAARADICSGEQCLLWRFTAPRQGGEFVMGDGEVEIGIGAYNCDGTYSYYGPNAAPDRTAEIGESDPGRWQAVKVPAKVDPAAQGIERYKIPFASNRNREIARSIFLWPADNSIDWELASSGFEITEFDSSDAARDCMGARDGLNWTTVGKFVSYSPMEGNDDDVSNLISQSYCSLLAFGLLPEGMKDTKCIDTARCMPGDGCLWVKLPDSLCPNDEAERAIFGCHLGAEGNPNVEDDYPATLNCTPEEPTEALDPEMGATSVGQCCDPLGQSATLPACNAYRTVQLFVAAAAEITDLPRKDLPSACQ